MVVWRWTKAVVLFLAYDLAHLRRQLSMHHPDRPRPARHVAAGGGRRRRLVRAPCQLVVHRGERPEPPGGQPGRAADGARMTIALSKPLTPFVDPLPAPRRLIAGEHGGRLSVRSGPERIASIGTSRIEDLGLRRDGPGPTIETERGQAVTVEWRNELEGPFPVTTTRGARERGRRRCAGAVRARIERRRAEPNAAALAGQTVVHLHGGLTPASYDGWAENLFATRPAGRLPLPERPARGAALVPRPRHGRHQVRRLRRARRALDHP